MDLSVNKYGIKVKNNSRYPYLEIELENNSGNKLAYAYYVYKNGNLIFSGKYTEENSFQYTISEVGIYKIRIFVKLFEEHYSNAYSLYEEMDYSFEKLFNDVLDNNNNNNNNGILSKIFDKASSNKKENQYISEALLKVISDEKQSSKKNNSIINRLISGYALKKDFFEYLMDKGFDNFAIYSSTIIGDYLYLMARFCGVQFKNMISTYDRVSDLQVPSEISKIYYKSYQKVDSLADDTTLIICEDKDYNLIKERYKNVNCLSLEKIVTEFFDEALVCDPLVRVQVNNPEVKILICNNPSVKKINKPSEHELKVDSFLDRIKEYNGNDPVFGIHGKDEKYITEVTSGFSQAIDDNGVMHYEDRKGEAVNIIAGRRVTTDQPKQYDNTIYLFGSSLCVGTGADDKHTIASCLQRCVLENGLNYRVVNCANYSASDDDRQMKLMETMNFNPGDIIVSMIRVETRLELLKELFLVCDIQHAFDRPHDMGEVFMDNSHLNFVGNNTFAKVLFDFMQKENIFEKKKTEIVKQMNNVFSNKLLNKNQNPELLDYEKNLRELARKNKTQIGAIVANCNPFTYGHLYLMETAAKNVSHLYVFVVEEDSSYFSFKDRFELVKEGTKHLENVTVIPSGKFIISKETFPAYSNKENLKNEVIDPSYDVKMFAQNIAPVLGITVRFAGEEPMDNVTNQYNNTMRDILPQYGIDFQEISRKSVAENVISASLVRKLLEEKRFDEIKKYVPEVTYNFLKGNY